MENIIIHTTKSFDKLNSILRIKKLNLSFSSEDFTWNGMDVSKAAHPMVCFSEYNPKKINEQKITYGMYSIGFSKDWARKKGIGPVLYVNDSTVAAKGMRQLLVSRRKKSESTKLSPKIRLAIMEVKCFMKNEIGYNSYTGDKEFDFKSENEWRYVPRKDTIDNFFISENQSTYKNNKDRYNKKVEKFPLKFELCDIQYLFVPHSDERNLIHNRFNIDKTKIKISKWKTR